jgi:hypothetical protein
VFYRKKESLGSLVETRSWDVISNRYHHDHEKKVSAERKTQRQKAAEKFWQVYDYDPIRATHYDPDTEKTHDKLDREHRSKQVQQHYARMPKCVRNSEGEQYDIVGLDKNPPSADQQKHQPRLKHVTEERIRSNDFANQDRKAQRAINKVSHRRYNEMSGRGYNIISGTSYQGRTGQSLPPAKTKPQSSLWQTIRDQR